MHNYNTENKEWSGTHIPSVLNPRQNLGPIILTLLERNPTNVTQISADSGATVTCGEMHMRSVRVAQNLIKIGLKQGDMVSLAVKNHENMASILFGCFCIGAPMSGLDPKFNEDDMTRMLQVLKPALIICEDENLDIIKLAASHMDSKPKVMVFGPSKDGAASVYDLFVATGIEHDYRAPYLGNPSQTIAFISCSSGTTGPMKGVCFSHAMLLEQSCSANLILTSGQSILYFTSLFWVSGIIFTLRGVFDCLTRIITTEDFSPETTFDIIQKYKPNFVLAPGIYLSKLVEHERLETTDLSSIRIVIATGSILSETLKNKMNKHLKYGKVGNVYGLSEIGGSATCDFLRQKENSVGHLMPNMRAKIVDDHGNRLGIGETGEICLKFSQPCLGYYNDAEANKSILDSDGWLQSGDLGFFDAEGFLFIVDRKKEIFKYQGRQIFPVEIEELLLKHENIQEVCVTCVRCEEEQTDLPAAIVVRKPNSTFLDEEIIDYAEENITTLYKKLRGGIYFTDKLPRTMNGKLQRRMVQKLATEEYMKRGEMRTNGY